MREQIFKTMNSVNEENRAMNWKQEIRKSLF